MRGQVNTEQDIHVARDAEYEISEEPGNIGRGDIHRAGEERMLSGEDAGNAGRRYLHVAGDAGGSQ